jgi:activating signal cointegrator 1
MKAITICQPYAHLICLPETDPRHKRVENREWETKYRGPLLIHAGKGTAYLGFDYDIPRDDMVFGAVVGRCDLVDCLWIDEIAVGEHDKQYPWIRTHQHTEGSWCLVLANVLPLPKAIPYKGALSLWKFPDELIPKDYE